MDALDVFCEVIELPADERAAAVERLCGDDAEVRREVEDLLRHHERPAAMLQTSRRVRLDVSTLLPEHLQQHDADEAATPSRWRRRAAFAACAVLLVTGCVVGTRALRASWRRTELAETAMRAARAAADDDPAAAKRQLERVPPALRDDGWRALRERLDPAVAVVRAAQLDGVDAFDGDVAFLPDSRACVAFAEGNRVRLLDVASGRTIRTFAADTDVQAPRIDMRAQTLCAWAEVEQRSMFDLYTWDIGSGAELATQRVQAPAIDDVRFAQDGDALLCRFGERAARIDLRAGTQRDEQRGAASVTEVTSSGARWCVDIDADGCVRLREGRAHRCRLLGRHDGAMLAAAFSPDERWLATAGADACIRIWSIADADASRVVARRAKRVALSPDGAMLLALGPDEAALLRVRGDQR